MERTQTKTRPKSWQRSFGGMCGPHIMRMGSIISQMGQASVASELQSKAQLSLAAFRQAKAKETRPPRTLQGSFQGEETKTLSIPAPPPGLHMNMKWKP